MFTYRPHFCSPLQNHSSRCVFNTSPPPLLDVWQMFQTQQVQNWAPDLLLTLSSLSLLNSGNAGSTFLIVQTINLGASFGPSSSQSTWSQGTACQPHLAHAHLLYHCILLPKPPSSLPWVKSPLIFPSASLQTILNGAAEAIFGVVVVVMWCSFWASVVEWLPIWWAHSLQWPARPHLLWSHASSQISPSTCPLTQHESCWPSSCWPTVPYMLWTTLPRRHFPLLSTQLSPLSLTCWDIPFLVRSSWINTSHAHAPPFLCFIFLHGFSHAEPDYVLHLLAHNLSAPRGLRGLFCFCSLLLYFLAHRGIQENFVELGFQGLMHLGYHLICSYSWICLLMFCLRIFISV